MSERNIQYVGMPDLDAIDKSRVLAALESSYDKILKIINNELLMKVHFKEQRSSGKTSKHTVNINLSFSGLNIVSKESDWRLINAVQKATFWLGREAIKAVKRR